MRIGIYIVKRMFLPLIISTLIAIFLLTMQFLWKYVDELIGKGLGIKIVLELITYAVLNVVVLAYPIAVLLSSIYVFSVLAEQLEIISIYSLGKNVQGIIKGPFIFICFLVLVMIIIVGYVVPTANARLIALINDIRQKQPEIEISEGAFNNQIEGLTFRVSQKVKKGEHKNKFKDIYIGDHTNESRLIRILKAEYGNIYHVEGTSYVSILLENGVIYEEIIDEYKRPMPSRPFLHIKFNKLEKNIEIPSIKFSRTDPIFFRDNYQMLYTHELFLMKDSIKIEIDSAQNENAKAISSSFLFMKNFKKPLVNWATKQNNAQPFETTKGEVEKKIFEISNTLANIANFRYEFIEAKRHYLNLHLAEIHKRIAIPFTGIVMFLLGSALGLITNRGSLPLSVVLASVVFMLFYVFNVFSETLVKNDILPHFIGIWLAPILFTIIAISLLYLLNKGYLRLPQSITNLLQSI